MMEADASFAVVDIEVFKLEMTALRLELFGLAWIHQLKKDKYVLPEIFFTKNYLEQNKQQEIWNIMGEYNQAIARSGADIASGERMRRGWVSFINTLRIELFKKWVEAGVDEKCAARVSNRTGTDVAWSKQITLNYLTARLADRLGCDINTDHEALFKLQAVILGLYNGATEAIKSVNLQVS
ncbi:hypothetical protein ACFLUP_01755 [Chloroflexota bacterium]